MKKFSKALMGVTALVIAFSASALVGCGGDPKDGSIKGDYQEATPEQVTQTLETVDETKLLGDSTAEGYKFGLDLSSEFSINVTNTYANATTSSSSNTTATFTADYKALMSNENGKTTEKGAGNVTLNAKNTSKTGTEEKVDEQNVKVDMYLDDAMEYVTTKIGKDDDQSSSQTIKAKINLEMLLGGLTGGIGSVPSTPASPSLDLSAISSLTELGAKISMDTSDGTKIKVSFDQSLIATIFNMSRIMSAAPQVSTTLPEGITANKCALDIYLSLDKSNVFTAASVVIDLDIAIDGTKLFTMDPSTYDAAPAPATETNLTTIKVNGFFKVKADNKVNPEIPAGLATDTTYLDMTAQLAEALDSIIGGYLPE